MSEVIAVKDLISCPLCEAFFLEKQAFVTHVNALHKVMHVNIYTHKLV